jgi:hypothetical protein
LRGGQKRVAGPDPREEGGGAAWFLDDEAAADADFGLARVSAATAAAPDPDARTDARSAVGGAVSAEGGGIGRGRGGARGWLEARSGLEPPPPKPSPKLGLRVTLPRPPPTLPLRSPLDTPPLELISGGNLPTLRPPPKGPPLLKPPLPP